MIRIVRILTRLNIGGPAIHAALLCGRLDPARFHTCLVCGTPDATEGDLSDLVDRSRTQLIRVSALRRPIHPWRDAVALAQIVRILWRERPHIIHTHMAKAGLLGRLAGCLYNLCGPGSTPGARARLIHTFHGHVLEGYFPLWVSRGFVTIERWLGRRTDCLIAVSRTIQNELLSLGIGSSAQWRVIPLGLELSAFARLPATNGALPVRVGLVGRLVPIKNPELFLVALNTLARQPAAHPVSGVVVGDGPLRRALEREARRLGLERLVEFTGWRRDLCDVYASLDGVCLTSWNEGTPVALIEAMAAGRPVVATDVGGVRDLLEDEERASEPIAPGRFRVAERGILVRPGDAAGLAAALEAVSADAPLRRRLGEAGRTYVLARHGDDRLIERMTALYEHLEQGRVASS